MATPTTATLDPQHDTFADWLSPILVKELRQGMKTYAFATVFIGIQLVMILTFGIQALFTKGPQADFSDAEGFFWAMIWVPALIIMPMRGMSAVTEEYKAQTLELMQMTHMSSVRIVIGKWIGIVAQTLLILTSLLPYAILRYFFGGVDLTADLKNMVMIMLASVTLSASMIAISTLHGALRGLVTIAFVWAALGLGNMGRYLFRGGSGSFFFGSSMMSWWAVAGVGLIAAGYTAFSLEIAASRIAPEAENHAMRKRLVACAVLLAATAFVVLLRVLGWDREYGVGALGMTLPILVWTMVDGLTELPIANPQTYRTMATRSWLVRRLGIAFHPGWPSALIFAMLTFGLFFAALARSIPITAKADELRTMMILAGGWLLTPLLPLLWMKNLKQRMMGFLGIQLLCLLLFIVANIMKDHSRLASGEGWTALSFIPSCSLYIAMDEGFANGVAQELAAISGVVTLGILAILLLRAMNEYKLMLKVERITRQGGEG